MAIIDNVAVLLLDSLFETTAKALKKYRLVVDRSGVSIKIEETPTIDERIAKIDEGKNKPHGRYTIQLMSYARRLKSTREMLN